MGAFLRDLPVCQDHDPVRVPNGVQPMGDDDAGAAFLQLPLNVTVYLDPAAAAKI